MFAPDPQRDYLEITLTGNIITVTTASRARKYGLRIVAFQSETLIIFLKFLMNILGAIDRG